MKNLKNRAALLILHQESLFEQVVFKKCTPSSFSQPSEINSEIESENYEEPQ